MAKMFYTLEEAAAKLNKSPDEVRKMAESGQLQEFRDRDRLMFKVEQVDLLAQAGEEGVPLADDLEPISLASSGSGTGISLADSKEGTGVSIFDAEDADEADPSAQTVMTDTAGATAPDFSMNDPASSGSGLLDLTRESDDTSLGADLLQDVYGETDAEASAAGVQDQALFESTGPEQEAPAAPQMAGVAIVEPIEPGWSAATAVVSAIAAIIILAALSLMTMAMIGISQGRTAAEATGGLVESLPANIALIGLGAGGGVAVLYLLLGALLGRKKG